jgi:tetracycline repressor-like protein
MYEGIGEFSWVVDVLAAGDLIPPSILWLVEEIVAGFVALGLSRAQAVDAYRAVWQFTVGALIIRRGLAELATLGRPPRLLNVLTEVDPRRFPALASVAPYWAPARGRDSYDIGLDALLDGLLSMT